jgi:hypothetical protein
MHFFGENGGVLEREDRAYYCFITSKLSLVCQTQGNRVGSGIISDRSL